MIGEFAVDIQRNFAAFHHLRESDAWLPEPLDHWHPPSRRLDGAFFQRGQIAVKPLPSCDESRPAVVVDEPDFPAGWREPEVGVVYPQQQPVLGPRREHAIGLEASSRDEVVHKDPDVGVSPTEREWRLPSHTGRGIDSGHETLRRRLLVA